MEILGRRKRVGSLTGECPDINGDRTIMQKVGYRMNRQETKSHQKSELTDERLS